MAESITTRPLAMRPTRLTLFFRTFLLWQIVRFVLVNLRMTMMILKSHDTRRARPSPPPSTGGAGRAAPIDRLAGAAR